MSDATFQRIARDLRGIVKADKTVFRTGERRPFDGAQPPKVGSRWSTPAEIARDLLVELAREGHITADEAAPHYEEPK